MKKVIELSKVLGDHTIFVNSKTPITQKQIQRIVPQKVKVVVEGPRVLWKDVKENLPIHIGVVVLTGGVGLLGYAGFWIYERWKPLYIVSLDVGELDNHF
jgi:hypothetical protein